MLVHHVRIEQFEGPLDLLLQLIEREELSITDISLAQVTDEYLRVVRSEKMVQPEELADFLVVASKLILIKSQLLLPGLALEEEGGPTLEEQLKLYRAFVDASKNIEDMIKKKRFMFGRVKPLIERVPEFSPPPRLTVAHLARAFQQVLEMLAPIMQLPKTAIKRAISIQEKISHIRALILKQVAVSFHDVLRGAKTKTERIVSFLALLELMKQRVVDVEQKELFQEITFRKS